MSGSICTSQIVQQCVGGGIQRLLARSAVYLNPSEDGKLLVCAGDEDTKSVSVVFLCTAQFFSVTAFCPATASRLPWVPEALGSWVGVRAQSLLEPRVLLDIHSASSDNRGG